MDGTGQRAAGEHAFDRDYWEQHWTSAHGPSPNHAPDVHPELAAETRRLAPGTALDAGCGAGAEAVWLAQHGWRVTGADISSTALATAAARAESADVSDRVAWVEGDLTLWAPKQRWDLVITTYAHPSIPQLAFYSRLGSWVASEGTLLIIGHLHTTVAHGDHGHALPEETTVAVDDVVDLFGPTWRIETARSTTRTTGGIRGDEMALHDLIVRVRRTD